MKEVGNRIKALREAKGWSALRLAIEANLGPATVYNLERGVSQYPKETSLSKLAAALGVSLPELMST